MTAGATGRRIVVLTALVLALASTAGAVPASGAGESELAARSKPLLVAFDLRSGRQQWRMRASGPGGLGVVSADRAHVFVELVRCLSLDRKHRSGDSVLVALDAKTGNERWRVDDVSGPAVQAPGRVVSPDALEGASAVVVPLYSPSRDVVTGLDPKTGRERWHVRGEGLQPVAATRDLLFLSALPLTAGPSRVRALDTRTGTERWSRSFDQLSDLRVAVGPTAAVVLGKSVAQPGRAQLSVLDLADGSVTAEFPVEPAGVNVAGLVVTRDVVAIAAFSGASTPRTLAYDLTGGRGLWSADGAFARAGAVGGADVLFGSTVNPAAVTALDAKTGSPLWTTPNRGGVFSSPAGSVVAGRSQEYDGRWSVVDGITAFDKETGRVRWSITPGRRHVTSTDRRRYPNTYTTGAFVGPRSVYVDGGCAATSLA